MASNPASTAWRAAAPNSSDHRVELGGGAALTRPIAGALNRPLGASDGARLDSVLATSPACPIWAHARALGVHHLGQSPAVRARSRRRARWCRGAPGHRVRSPDRQRWSSPHHRARHSAWKSISASTRPAAGHHALECRRLDELLFFQRQGAQRSRRRMLSIPLASKHSRKFCMRIAVTGGTGYLGAHTVRRRCWRRHRTSRSGCSVRARWAAPASAVIPVDSPRSARWTSSDGDIRSARHRHPPAGRLRMPSSTPPGWSAPTAGAKALMWRSTRHATEAVLARAAEARSGSDRLGEQLQRAVPTAGWRDHAPTTPRRPGAAHTPRPRRYADRAPRGACRPRGAPVVITYPSSVVGPAFWTAAGVTERGCEPDGARQVAAPHARRHADDRRPRCRRACMPPSMRAGRGPRRYVCGGVMLTFDADGRRTRAGSSGRRIRRNTSCRRDFSGALGWVADRCGRVLPLGDAPQLRGGGCC